MHIVINHKWTSPSGNWQSTRDRRPPRLRIPQGHSARRLVATFRYAWTHQDGDPQNRNQLRAYLNYVVRF